MTNPQQFPQSSGYRPYFAPGPSTPRTGPEPRPRSRGFVILVVVLIVLLVGGVVLGIMQMMRFGPDAGEITPLDGPTEVNFAEGESFWVYVPEAERNSAQCEVRAADGSTAPVVASSTTYTITYQKDPYSTVGQLPAQKSDPTATGNTLTVSCDSSAALAGPAPNTNALALGIAGIMLGVLAFIGVVVAFIVRAWLPVLRARQSFPGHPRPRR